MLGRIVLTEERRFRVHLAEESVFGLPLLRAELPQGAGPRRVRSAAKKLTRQGVRRVLTPPDFPFWPELEAWGLAPVEPAGLCQTMAAPLALAVLKHQGVRASNATVALRGERVTRSMRLAALALCPQVRCVLISAPIGGEGLQAELRREFGIPALAEGGGRSPDAAFHFSPARGGGQILCLYGAEPDLKGYQIIPKNGALPPDWATLPMLAALWETGRLAPADMDVIPCSGT